MLASVTEPASEPTSAPTAGSALPDTVVVLAEERSLARAARDWGRADELREAIEEAGWRIEDAGTAYRLRPAQAPDVMLDGRRLHGSVASIPSMFVVVLK